MKQQNADLKKKKKGSGCSTVLIITYEIHDYKYDSFYNIYQLNCFLFDSIGKVFADKRCKEENKECLALACVFPFSTPVFLIYNVTLTSSSYLLVCFLLMMYLPPFIPSHNLSDILATK